MKFDSVTFILFLVVVLLFYYGLRSWISRKVLLLVASYLFYAAWNPPFVLLLWLSTIVDWFVAGRIAAVASAGMRRALLGFSLLSNLGLLAVFKYGNFALQSFTEGVEMLGVTYVPPQLNIVLPVGISFYTFQTLSYTIDVYRGDLKPTRNFLDYALFVTFFPQLVAGPIVRAPDFLPQTLASKPFRFSFLAWGASLVLLGLFQKQFLSDRIFAPVADRAFDPGFAPTLGSAWTGALAFSGQIFCDFAGYTTTAIGCALMLGFALPDNFRGPYAAIGFSDFWRRWHISLSTWLRDYLYIPLGGNRRGPLRTDVNLLLTMLIGGLWHGASWTFVAWGTLHGLFLVIERRIREWWPFALPHGYFLFGLGLLTFALVTLAWVPFRATSFSSMFALWSAMLGGAAGEGRLSPTEDLTIIVGIVVLLTAHWLLRDKVLAVVVEQTPPWVLSCCLGMLLYVIATFPSQDRAFIYFQF